MDGHTTITEVDEEGQPKAPAGIKTRLVNQCGYLVRESIPIKYRLWKKTKKTDRIDEIVPDSEKEMIWQEVSKHFGFPSGKEGAVKKWAFQKMAIQFQTFKKNLIKNYVKKGLTPNFDKCWKKQRMWWNDFVNYKSSADSLAASQHAKEISERRTQSHHLGSGGYDAAIPKWEKMEADIIAKGIVPQTLSWPKRARYYFYAHGGRLDPETGAFITSDAIREATQRLNEALRLSEEGSFQPNRENDELTYALGNPEHTGRTRGIGVVPWKRGFAADLETYRSRCRSKAAVAQQFRMLNDRINTLEARVNQQQHPAIEAAANLEISPGSCSHRRSSVASTELPQGDVNELVAENQRHPVDDITVRTKCELLYLVGKKLKYVADGYAEVPEEGGMLHCRPIPEGYAKVFVDRVTEERWEDLDLPIELSPEESELRFAVHTWIAWPKHQIRLDQAGRPESDQCSRQRSATPADKSPSVEPHCDPLPAHDSSSDSPSPAARSEPTPIEPKSRPNKAHTTPTVREPAKKSRKKKANKAQAEVEEEEIDPVRQFFEDIKRKRDEKNKKLEVDPVGKAFFIKETTRPKPPPISDYDRQLRKSYKDPANRVVNAKAKGKSIPQLGQQSKQTIEPLIVPRQEEPNMSQDPITMADMVLQTNLTYPQLLGRALQEALGKKKFKLGEPLVWPQLIKYLPTRMFELHKWYAVQSQNGLEMFPARIKDEHFWRGAADVWIEFLALYDLYHQDALHKSLMSVWMM